jgi:hypothetical protein
MGSPFCICNRVAHAPRSDRQFLRVAIQGSDRLIDHRASSNRSALASARIRERRCNTCPGAHARIKVAFRGQLVEGLDHCPPRHSERCRQSAGGRQPLAGLQLACRDRGAQTLGELPVDLEVTVTVYLTPWSK